MNRTKVGELRPAQFLSTFGPGSIIDLPDFSAMVAGTHTWTKSNCENLNEPRLVARLKINAIKSLPFNKNPFSDSPTLPVIRFPEWYICPACRRLAHYTEFIVDPDTGVVFCSCKGSKTKTFPARFITICKNGHTQDFPWQEFVHEDQKNNYEDHVLYLSDSGLTGSLRDIEVKCETCNIKRSIQDAFTPDAAKKKILGLCKGRRPWINPNNFERDCTQSPHAVLRGASNVYFPVQTSVISIPPWTSPEHEAISSISDRLEKVKTKEQLNQLIEMDVLNELKGLDINHLWTALEEQRNLKANSDRDLLFEEWNVLNKGNTFDADHEFETEQSDIPAQYTGKVDQLIKVRRLVEVRVLRGFTRIDSLPDDTDALDDQYNINDQPEFCKPGSDDITWLPGLKTKGEGIFIALNESAVQAWEHKVNHLEPAVSLAYRNFFLERNTPMEHIPSFPGMRYLLLHTLSHIIIMQLYLNTGYSAASIRERIYSRNTKDRKMAGILLYTATPDSEGSLGGLVEQGESNNFSNLLWQALNNARFCSSDPLCSEMEPGNKGLLNGAACHACLLLPETSCENSNRFLDRSLVVPTVSFDDRSFFREDEI